MTARNMTNQVMCLIWHSTSITPVACIDVTDLTPRERYDVGTNYPNASRYWLMFVEEIPTHGAPGPIGVCQGHPNIESDNPEIFNGPIGGTFYCDGSCQQ